MPIHLSHIVNSVFTSRTYVLSRDGSSSVWLVDCGDVEKLPEGVQVEGVLLTHGHFDHIYGLPGLLERFPDCRVVTNGCGLETLADARKNMSKYHESPLEVVPEHPVLCLEGDVVELFGGVRAVVYETPGHHPSCLSFRVEDWLFTGDAYIPGVMVVTNMPGGDRRLAEESVDRIVRMAEEKGLAVCAGHEH